MACLDRANPCTSRNTDSRSARGTGDIPSPRRRGTAMDVILLVVLGTALPQATVAQEFYPCLSPSHQPIPGGRNRGRLRRSGQPRW